MALLDTNVLASGVVGFQFLGSIPGEILRLWRAHAFTLVVSEHILGELERTLENPYFSSRLADEARRSVITVLRMDAVIQSVPNTVARVATHSEDDYVVAAALGANVQYVVTGDRQLQHLRRIKDTEFISPRTFLMHLEA